MERLVIATLLGLCSMLLTPGISAQTPTHVYVTTGLGTSHPARPGAPSAATELGIDAQYKAWGIALRTHQEGTGTLQGQGTSSLARLGLSFSPSLSAERYLRTEAYTFLLVDVVPNTGYGVDVAYGLQHRLGSLGGFVDFHTPYYGNDLLPNLTLGLEAQSHWRLARARVRVGTVGGTRPYALVTVGLGYTWK